MMSKLSHERSVGTSWGQEKKVLVALLALCLEVRRLAPKSVGLRYLEGKGASSQEHSRALGASRAVLWYPVSQCRA